MLVDVIELCRQGQKLSREARGRITPVRGRLTVDRRWTHSNLDNPPLYADLYPFTLETLCQVRLRFWRGRNLVLSGNQKGAAPGSKRDETFFEQWWWCQIVVDPSVPPKPLCQRHGSAVHPLGGDPAYGGLM